MKESYVSIIFLIISGSSLRRKINKISFDAETLDDITTCPLKKIYGILKIQISKKITV